MIRKTDSRVRALPSRRRPAPGPVAATAAVMLLAALPLLAGCGGGSGGSAGDGGDGPIVLRVGHFPNVTHAQALVAHHLSRQGEGWFEKRLGGDATIEWYVYNAGPSAMEGLLNGSLDLTYVGPNPALNAHIRSGGEDIRVLSGAARGGSGMVVHRDSRIVRPEDFRGRRIATPQLGNTQDIACRAWLIRNHYVVTPTGGDVTVIPTANPDQMGLLFQGKVDAVWTVEPWLSKLEIQGKGTLFLKDDDAVTTLLASSARLLARNPDLVERFVEAHRELTAWINENPDEARRMAEAELLEEIGGRLPGPVYTRAWGRLTFTTELALTDFERFVADAQLAGFMDEEVDLGRLMREP